MPLHYYRPARLVLALVITITFWFLPQQPGENPCVPMGGALLCYNAGTQPPESTFQKAVSPRQYPHRFREADAFLPHFESALLSPNMTLAQGKAGCTWPESVDIPYQFQPDNAWVNASWIQNDTPDHEIAERRSHWQDFVKNDLLPYEEYKDWFSGRGIVIAGGNGETVQRIKVLLRALGRLESKLPVEVHYWKHELTQQDKIDIVRIWPKTYFNDLSYATNIARTEHNPMLINYQLKTAAVLNSRFAEPFLMDSDNIPMSRPEELYDSPTYKEYGTVFWPDIARTRPNNPIWAITNTVCKMDEWEQESGQMIVDKRRFFYHLQLAAWFNNNHGSYYSNLILGDKDMFRFAWHALKTEYGHASRFVTSVGTHFDLPDGGKSYCGHTYAQFHPDDGSLAFLHGGWFKSIPKQVLRWARKEHNGTFLAVKRAAGDQDARTHIRIATKWDAAEYLPSSYGPTDGQALCADFPDAAVQPIDDLIPGFEEIFEGLGGYWMLDGPADSIER